jgi:hypothetical protein
MKARHLTDFIAALAFIVLFALFLVIAEGV